MSAHAILNFFLKGFGSNLVDESIEFFLEIEATIESRRLTTDFMLNIVAQSCSIEPYQYWLLSLGYTDR